MDCEKDDRLPFLRIGPSGSDRLGSALLMYTTEPLRPPTVYDLMVDAAKLRHQYPEPGATRIDLSMGARDAILRSPIIHRPDVAQGLERFISSSQATIFGIPVQIDPQLPDGIVVFRDREGNTLHTILLVE